MWNPLTLAQINTLLSSTVGSLKPYQLDQLADALARRYWTPQSPAANQPTLTTIAGTWSN